MSNYTKSTNFATTDNLTPGDPLKVVRGTEIDTEFNNISTAVATKTDNSAAAITGGAIDGATVGATTPATGAFTTLAASGTTTLAGALVGAATQSAFNTVSTTLNLGGAATALNLGAATGTATVNNTTLAAKAITASTTLAVTGTSTLTGAVTATAGVSGPITSSSVSITGGSITGITDLAVADGGTGASTAAGGLNNLLPSQTGNASKYLQTDGTNASWDAVSLSTADITGTLGAANGGTGVSNNAAMTVTGSGNFAYTRTLTGTTNVTFPTTGTLATLAGTETLTNKTLTSPILTTPTLGVATGTSFQGIIGNVTPAAGSFTTLGASSTATLNTLSSSGATLTGGTINGMTVGATTASSGAFTTVTASTAIGTASGGTGLTSFNANGIVHASSTSALATSSALTWNGSKLTVVGGNAGQFVLDNANEQYVQQVFQRNGTANTGADLLFDGTASTFAIRTLAVAPIVFSVSASAGSPAEGMRLTSTGLGIGTSSPATKLDIRGSNTILRIGSDTNDIGTIQFFNTTGSTINSTISGNLEAGNAGGDLRFSTKTSAGSLTERIRILSAGNVGIGTSAPATLLDIRGSSTALRIGGDANDIGTIQFFNTTGSTINSTISGNLENGAAGGDLRFATKLTAGSLTERMRLDSAGNLGLGVTPSAWGTQFKALELANGISLASLVSSANLGLFTNAYYNGSNYIYKTTNFASEYEQVNGIHKWYTAASGTAGNAITFSTAMTLDASGNLSAGTTSIASSGQTNSITAGSVVAVKGTLNAHTTSAGIIQCDGVATTIRAYGTSANGLISFNTGGGGATADTERARITSDGNFLVGDTANSVTPSKLYVLAPSTSHAAFFKNITAAYETGVFWNSATSGDNFFAGFYTETSITPRGSISYNRAGGLTVYNTTSDYRAKDISGPVTNSGALIDSVPVYMGKMKWAEQERPMFIAHEVPAYAHTGEKDAVDADGNPVYQQMDASALIPVMWAEIQSLRQRVAQLER